MTGSRIIGIGEVLWDLIPGGRMPGGAPANFAYVASKLGHDSRVMSRVGDDQAGADLCSALSEKGIGTALIQTDDSLATGTVGVEFVDGQPHYEIFGSVAWDHLESTPAWLEASATCDAVCFGSLAQRSAKSRETIFSVVGKCAGMRVFDVNLRQSFWNAAVIRDSFVAANVVKLNDEEFPLIAKVFGLESADTDATAEALINEFALTQICITRGARGSVIYSAERKAETTGLEIEVADTIGAGDAFTAGVVHGLLNRWDLERINTFANRVGAFVAARTGAMPDFRGFLL